MNGFISEFFGFRKMVSAVILKFVYVLGALGITLAGLQQLFNSPMYGLGLIIMGNLLWRIICESLILLFSIHQELVKIARK